MKKIPTIFKRDLKLKCTPVTEEINPECQWVFDGEGIATRKIDGVNIRVKDGVIAIRQTPLTREYTEAEYEPLREAPNNSKHIEAACPHTPPDGIYEAYGEGIRGNAEKVEGYHMVRIDPVDHALVVHGVPRTYRGLMGYLATHDIEGIVFHHPDRIRMAKIKTKDFYHLKRP
jgi:hypothetical protein